MSCRGCTFAAQGALNIAVALDRLGNAFLGGDPAETLSQRTARARAAGHAWAAVACRALTLGSRAFGQRDDHCDWALGPGTSGLELWAWSPDAPRRP